VPPIQKAWQRLRGVSEQKVEHPATVSVDHRFRLDQDCPGYEEGDSRRCSVGVWVMNISAIESQQNVQVMLN
jgi:hypothetical protein